MEYVTDEQFSDYPDLALMGAKRSRRGLRDRDVLDRRPARQAESSSEPTAHLPTQEPQEASLEDRHATISRELAELAGTLRYMGKSHPQRDALEQKVNQLRIMLQQLEREL